MFQINFATTSTVRHLGYVKYHEPWTHFERTLNEYVCYIVITGDLFIEEGHKQHHIRSGDVFFLEPNMLHKGYHAAPCEYYYVHFTHNDFHLAQKDDSNQRLYMDYQESDIYSNHRNIKTIAAINKKTSMSHHRLFSEIVSTLIKAVDSYYRREIGYHQFCDNSFNLVLLYLTRFKNDAKPSKQNSHLAINAIIDYIHANYRHHIDNKMLEDLTGYHGDYLNRIFKRQIGSTIHQYLTSLRIEQSKELLRTTEMTINAIALAVGFNDPFYFARVFKKVTHYTPSQFRNS